MAEWYQKKKIKQTPFANVRDVEFDPWVEKTLWNRSKPLSILALEQFHEQESLVGYGPWGSKKLDMTKRLTHTQTKIIAVND